MIPDEILELVEKFDINNIKDVLIIGAFVLLFIVYHIRSLYASNVELLFMKDKELRIRVLFVSVIVCVLCFLLNFIFLIVPLMAGYAISYFFIFLLLFFIGNKINSIFEKNSNIIYIRQKQIEKNRIEIKSNKRKIEKHITKIKEQESKIEPHKKKIEECKSKIEKYEGEIEQYEHEIDTYKNKIKKIHWIKAFFSESRMEIFKYCFVVVLILAIITLFHYIQSESKFDIKFIINIYSLAAIGSIIQTISIFFILEDISPVYNIMIFTPEKKLYVYRKLNDELLLCGDDKIMSDATKMLVISLTEIYEQKYIIKKYNLVDDSESIGEKIIK